MPVKIESFEPLSDEEFTALRQQKTRKTDPAMVALLAEVEAGRPVRVPLVEGQSARGLRTAISRAATSRGLSVETVEGEGFVAVRKSEEPRTPYSIAEWHHHHILVGLNDKACPISSHAQRGNGRFGGVIDSKPDFPPLVLARSCPICVGRQLEEPFFCSSKEPKRGISLIVSRNDGYS